MKVLRAVTNFSLFSVLIFFQKFPICLGHALFLDFESGGKKKKRKEKELRFCMKKIILLPNNNNNKKGHFILSDL